MLSSTNYPMLLAFGLSLLGVVAFGYFIGRGRTRTLDQLVMAPDERVLFTDDGGNFDYFVNIARWQWFLTRLHFSHIVVTNRRIICTMRPIFQTKNPRYVIQLIVNYTDAGPPLTQARVLGGTIFDKSDKENKNAFLTLYAKPEEITFVTKQNQPAIKITVPIIDAGGALMSRQATVYIFTKDRTPYEKVFNKE